MRAALRREGPALAAVIVAVVGVLAPLTLEGRLASSADLDAFYAPFASFLHDRLAHGDIPYWAPGAFSGQPFLADAQSGVTYPPMLLASWLLGPIDALRAVATFHYLIAALGTYALARQLGASRTGSAFGAVAFAASGHLVARSAALGLLGGAAWLAPALALAEAAASARPSRRGLAIAGLALVLALHLASGSQQLAALTLVTSAIWLVSRAGARGARDAVIAIVLALGLAAVALVPRLELLRLATASGYVDPDGIGSLIFGDRRALVGRSGLSHSEIETLYIGAATPVLALIGWWRGRREGLPARLLGWLIAFSVAWAAGLVGWLLDPVPLVRTVAGHEPVRGIVLALLCACVLAAFALPEATRWPSALKVGALGLVVGRPARRIGRPRALVPRAARGRVRRACAAPSCARAARPARRARRRPGLAGDASGSSAALAARVADRPDRHRAAPRSCSHGNAPKAPSGSPPPRPSRCSSISSARTAHRMRAPCCSTRRRCGSGSRMWRATTRCTSSATTV